MGNTLDSIDAALAKWIARQHVFFVATAPLAATGHVNCSPKGGDTLRVLGPREVAYIDGMGSGIETVSHIRENGRLVIMLCAFEGPPRIVRLHGRAEVLAPDHAEFAAVLARFPPYSTTRSIVRLHVDRVAKSCGWGVPHMDYRGERRDPETYVANSSDDKLRKYAKKNNQRSIDGLRGMDAAELEKVVIRRE